jgi:hypothetical protein
MTPFPTNKITFAEASEIVKKNELERLKRSSADEEVYRKYIANLKLEWASIGTKLS